MLWQTNNNVTNITYALIIVCTTLLTVDVCTVLFRTITNDKSEEGVLSAMSLTPVYVRLEGWGGGERFTSDLETRILSC